VLGHESILKLITYRFGLGDLVKRDAMANNIGQTFDWSATDLEPPQLPDPFAILSTPCALGGSSDRGELDGVVDHQNDLAALEDLAERYGIPIGDGSLDSIFREPDSIRKTVEETAAVTDSLRLP
jgi:phospholipase C